MKNFHLTLIACAAAFFLCVAWYGRPAGTWNSPDETANAFWAMRVAHNESLAVRDVVIGLGAGAIHPRSMAVIGDALVPGSFAGLILLYGALGMITKLPFFLMTPIFTLVAGAFFGQLVSRLFDRRVGYLAAILFFLHPAVLYYAARGLFHNVLFVDLLILSAACFALRKDRIGDALGGFLFGWAIFTRASEAVWAIPAFALFLPFAGKERWRRLGWAFAGAAIPLFLLLQTNASLYGSPFKSAYVVPPGVSESVASDTVAPASEAPSFALPFGFDAKRALRNAWSYGLRLFWWQSLLAVAGLVLWIVSFRKTSKLQKTYAFATVAVAAWLAVLYGSWAIRDRLDPSSVTIGTSYVRYFLPAYVAMLPFGALALAWLGEKVKKPNVAALALVVCGFLTFRATAYAGDESLRAVRATIYQNDFKAASLLESVFPPEAVIMTERFDKLFVPRRLRIIPTTDQAGFSAAAMAASYAPVYWYGLTPTEEELSRLQALAESQALAMVKVHSPVDGETAYLFEKKP